MPGAFDSTDTHTKDILNAIPKWYVRFGMPILAGVFVLLLLVSTRVSYPDYLETTGFLQSGSHTSPDSMASYFITRLPQQYMPLIKKGSTASLTIDAWPAVSQLRGEVDSLLPPMASDKTFGVRLRIREGMTITMPVQDSLTGTAAFLLGERSLFGQLFR